VRGARPAPPVERRIAGHMGEDHIVIRTQLQLSF